jgi:hypothetical protein
MTRSFQTLMASALVAGGLGSACIDVGADINNFVQTEERRFPVTGTPEVTLSTFNGAIEIRPWDRHEVQVFIERHASSRSGLEEIAVRSDHTGNQVTVEVTAPRVTGLGFHPSRLAKLIVSMPATANVTASSGDGSIDIEQIAGRFALRTGDGSIRGRDLTGNLNAHTGDGAIRLDGVNGALDIDTGDGSVVASGALTTVRAHTGDGSLAIRADAASAAAANWDLTTGDGSVTVELPSDFSGELDAHTGDGVIRLQNVTLSSTTDRHERHTVRGRLGSGDGSVRVRTGDGAITIRR